MICKFVKREIVEPLTVFIRKQDQNRKTSLHHKTPQFGKCTELTKTGSTPVQNSNIGLNSLFGENSPKQKSKTQNLAQTPNLKSYFQAPTQDMG